ncbi:tyrosine-type recombinase/integrase [Azospirillum thermophilum]|uniref:Tyr recombinase domain-containing protein n=1 Tax=Azospirillum thermophilum TaxID=2202148 RepID=A0A2S2CM14_9PROT|nr:tyrosine-type recombinase/integrase [Azospirillum thermophilum]AWK85347.1 hypothetical protein DEW08_03395 [Azospirillum thermophilum]
MTTPTPAVATLADVLAAIDTADLSPIEKTHLRSAVSRTSTWLERPVNAIPADRRSLGPALKALQRRCAAHGVTPKSVSNVLGLLNRGLDLVDRRPSALPPVSALRMQEWRDLYAAWRALVPKAYGPLTILIRYCDANDIAPGDVEDAVAERVIDYMSQVRLRDRDTAVHHLRGYWNAAIDLVPGWPQRRLTIGLKVRPKATLELSAFPASFRADLDRFRRIAAGLSEAEEPAGRRRYDFSVVVATAVADNARGVRQTLKPLSAESISGCINAVVMAATALVAQGATIADIKGVADVVTARGLAALVNSVLDRLEGRAKITRHVNNLVGFLLMVGARMRPDFAEDHEFHALARQIRADFAVEEGMTLDNAKILAQFDDSAAVRALFEMPGTVIARVEATRAARKRRGVDPEITPRMALQVMHAVAVMLLLSLPVRVGTLVRTEWSHVRLPKTRNAPGFIDWPAELIKTGTEASVELQPRKMQILRLWRDVYRPLLCDAQSNNFVFPAKSGPGHRNRSTLGNYLSALVRKHAGLRISSHKFRHLVRTLVLDADPSAEALANALLGHAPGSRAAHRYGTIRPTIASRALAGILERQAAAAKTRPSRSRRAS